MRNKLVKKVNAIDIKVTYQVQVLFSKSQYDSDKQNLKKKIKDIDEKIPNTSELIKKIDYNTNITKIENKIPNMIDLVTNTALNAKIIEI